VTLDKDTISAVAWAMCSATKWMRGLPPGVIALYGGRWSARPDHPDRKMIDAHNAKLCAGCGGDGWGKGDDDFGVVKCSVCNGTGEKP
jgi:hypothetical protein